MILHTNTVMNSSAENTNSAFINSRLPKPVMESLYSGEIHFILCIFFKSIKSYHLFFRFFLALFDIHGEYAAKVVSRRKHSDFLCEAGLKNKSDYRQVTSQGNHFLHKQVIFDYFRVDCTQHI